MAIGLGKKVESDCIVLCCGGKKAGPKILTHNKYGLNYVGVLKSH